MNTQKWVPREPKIAKNVPYHLYKLIQVARVAKDDKRIESYLNDHTSSVEHAESILEAIRYLSDPHLVLWAEDVLDGAWPLKVR